MYRCVAAAVSGVGLGLWRWVQRTRAEGWVGDRAAFEPAAIGADYRDVYVTPLPSPLSAGLLAEHGVQKGIEVARSETEVVFEDRAPGLRFVVAYEVDAARTRLAFSTAVMIERPIGRWYWTFVRPFHRLLAPLVPMITVRRASSANGG